MKEKDSTDFCEENKKPPVFTIAMCYYMYYWQPQTKQLHFTEIITSLPTVHVCTEPFKLEVKIVPLFVQARPVIGILCKPWIILCCGF